MNYEELVDHHVNMYGKWQERIAELEKRIAELEDRLELHAYDLKGNRIDKGAGAWDGIACRDETISLQRKRIAELEAERDQLAAANYALTKHVEELLNGERK